MSRSRRELILDLVEDMGSKELLYYGRRGDEDLPRGEIEEAVKEGEVTVEEIVAIFAKGLRERLNE